MNIIAYIPVSHTINCYVLTETKPLFNQGRARCTAQLLFMLVTTNHAEHVLNTEYLTSARIMHIFKCVLKEENLMRL